MVNVLGPRTLYTTELAWRIHKSTIHNPRPCLLVSRASPLHASWLWSHKYRLTLLSPPTAPHANMAYSSPSSYHPNSIPATSASPSHSQSPAPTAAVSMSGPPQSMPAGANPAMLLAQQQQQQHQQQLQLHLKQQQQQQQQAQPQLQQQSMQQQRSTPTNQSLGQQPQQNQQAQAQQVAPPSPAAAARERARVTALLEVNSALLQELLSLQASGKAGGAPQATATTTPEQQSALPNSATEPAGAPSDTPRKPSPEYLECLKRLQSNLVYLASVTDRNKKPVSPAPAILSPPPHMGSLNEKYSQLKELFAGVPRPAVVPQQKPGQPGIAAEHAV